MTAGCTLQFLDFRWSGVAAGCAGMTYPDDTMSEKLYKDGIQINGSRFAANCIFMLLCTLTLAIIGRACMWLTCARIRLLFKLNAEVTGRQSDFGF